jgi:hypothetical protein
MEDSLVGEKSRANIMKAKQIMGYRFTTFNKIKIVGQSLKED